MVSRGLVCLVCLTSACSFDGNTKQTGHAPDAAVEPLSDGGAEPEAPSKFSDDYEVWHVPASGTINGFYTANSDTASERWALIDVDGDGKFELVQTADSQVPAPAVWTDSEGAYWKIFANEEVGFAEAPTHKRVPNPGWKGGFYSVHQTGDWQVRDLNGDGELDLVQLSDPATNKPWEQGRTQHWRVYFGESEGFAVASQWIVPSVQDMSFISMGGCASAGCWMVVDLTGDGLEDFVLSSDADGAFDSPEAPNWHVYANTQTGYASEFSRWTLPKNGHERGFFSPNWRAFWHLVDITGDGVLDLVQTQDFIAGGVQYTGAQPKWLVFETEGSGFSTASTDWFVPTVDIPRGMHTLSISEGVLQWTTVDLNGDGHLDLVHTANHKAAIPTVWGAPTSDQWKVYLGGVGGFSAVQSWPVPDSGTEEGFYATTVSTQEQQWRLMDLDGDGYVELVQTADPTTGRVWIDPEGKPHWRIYRTVP